MFQAEHKRILSWKFKNVALQTMLKPDTWPLKQEINIKLLNNEQFYSRKI